MPDEPDPDPEQTRDQTPEDAVEVASPTAGGRSGWVVIAVVAVALIGVLALTAFWGDGTASSASSASSASGSTSSEATTPSTSGSCGAPTSEPLDPTAAVRLLPNAAEPDYANDPPTSGAFLVGVDVGPTPTEPLSRPVQVGLLAQGKVLIQYGADVSAADVADLRGLAGDDLVVAPNPTLTSPIVATAWRVRLTCGALDLSALRQFATLNANQAPDADASTTTTTG